MAGNDFEDLEVERTTRWIEHEQMQKKKKAWKAVVFAVPVIAAIALYLVFGR